MTLSNKTHKQNEFIVRRTVSDSGWFFCNLSKIDSHSRFKLMNFLNKTVRLRAYCYFNYKESSWTVSVYLEDYRFSTFHVKTERKKFCTAWNYSLKKTKKNYDEALQKIK